VGYQGCKPSFTFSRVWLFKNQRTEIGDNQDDIQLVEFNAGLNGCLLEKIIVSMVDA